MAFSEIRHRGLMLVLSSPSGAGKTTISRKLLKRDGGIVMSVSATTRPKRPGEVAGIDYNFVAPEEFRLMINRGEFLEHAKVFDYYYGTPAAPVMQALADGQDMLFDIDWQGAQQLAQSARDDLVSIFILPPTTAELERRLRTRAQDSATVVARRLAKAADEMSRWDGYDYIIVNRAVEESVDNVQAILAGERLRRERQVGLPDFVRRLQEGH